MGSDGGDGSTEVDGGRSCAGDPTLCEAGQRCNSSSLCVPCDADGDTFVSTDPACDALAGASPRDCNDDAARVYPGAPPVCGDGMLNDCSASPPATFLAATGTMEIGPLASRILVTDDRRLDLPHVAVGIASGTERALVTYSREGLYEGEGYVSRPTPVHLLDGDLALLESATWEEFLPSPNAPAVHSMALRASAGGAMVTVGGVGYVGDYEGRSFTGSVDLGASTLRDGISLSSMSTTSAACAEIGALGANLALNRNGSILWANDREAVAYQTGGSLYCPSVGSGFFDPFVAGSDGSVHLAAFPDSAWVFDDGTPGSAPDVVAFPYPSPEGAFALPTMAPGLAYLGEVNGEENRYLHTVATEDANIALFTFRCFRYGTCTDWTLVRAIALPDGRTTLPTMDALVAPVAALVHVEDRIEVQGATNRRQTVVARLLEWPGAVLGAADTSDPGPAIDLFTHRYSDVDNATSPVVRTLATDVTRRPNGDFSLVFVALLGEQTFFASGFGGPWSIVVGGLRGCAEP